MGMATEPKSVTVDCLLRSLAEGRNCLDDEFIDEPSNHALDASAELWGNAFGKGSDLGNSHRN